MQVIAMLTMLIDHIGIVFLPDSPILRIIGRLAFPIYAYALVAGYHHTSNRLRYMRRLLLVGLLAQWPYQWALLDDGINVVGTLLVSLGVLYAMDRLPGVRLAKVGLAIPLVAAAALVLELGNFDYGYYGLALVLLYRYSNVTIILALHALLNIIVLLDKGWTIQMYSLFATVLLVYGDSLLRAVDQLRPPRWVWRAFYPGHLALLALLRWMV